MVRYLVIGAMATAMFATAATAATSFDAAYEGRTFGANAPHFEYGYSIDGVFTAYTSANLVQNSPQTPCPIAQNVTSCLIGGPSGWLGSYFATADGPAQSAYIYFDDVSLHPGYASNQLAAVAFVAPTSGGFRFIGGFRGVDAPFGDGVTITTPNFSGTLGGNQNRQYNFSFDKHLVSGDRAVFTVGNNTGYSFDTTGLRLSVAAVPEPATWALMILGFGSAGAMLRRRRPAAAI